MDGSPASENDAARQAVDCRPKAEGRRSAEEQSSFGLRPSDFSLFTITLWEPEDGDSVSYSKAEGNSR